MNYFAVDIGGTSVKVGIVDELGNIKSKGEYPVSLNNYEIPFVDAVINGCKEFMKNNEFDYELVTVSATGQIDIHQGVVIGTCGNIPGYTNANLKARFEKEFGKKTLVANDANCAAMGEKWLGAAKDAHNVVCVTLGTGIGGGIIVNDQILTGDRGIACEIGHMIINMDGKDCTCGNKGCFEILGSTKNFVKKVEEETGLKDLNGREIFKMIRANHEKKDVMINAVNEWVDIVAVGLTSLVHIFNPEMIVIGGGVSKEEEYVINPIIKAVYSKIMPAFKDNLKIVPAELGNDAGMVGAVYNALNQ